MRVELSKEFLLSRGTCCKLGCKNCPYEILPSPPSNGFIRLNSNFVSNRAEMVRSSGLV